MNKDLKERIIYSAVILVGLYFLFAGLIEARQFLVPLSMAVILAMILLPVESKLRSWGLPRALSIVVADLLLMFFSAGLFLVLTTQVETITQNLSQYTENLEPLIDKLQGYISNLTGISRQEQTARIREIIGGETGEGSWNEILNSAISGLTALTGNALLVFVYIFFFMLYREKFKQAIILFFPGDRRESVSGIIDTFSSVSQKYLFGKFLLIILLAVVYSLGLALVGVRHALFVSIIAAVLSIIPYFGNVIGFAIAVSMNLLADGTLGTIVGIFLVFGITQFFESYIIGPYVVGHQVDINPAATLIVVIIGGMVWGLAGMILAVPLAGMLKVIFDNVPALYPLGYALNEKDTGAGRGWISKLADRLTGLLR